MLKLPDEEIVIRELVHDPTHGRVESGGLSHCRFTIGIGLKAGRDARDPALGLFLGGGCTGR
jgi:hypothetical protein